MEWARTQLGGRYRLDEPLGHGAMGEVWLAEDLELHRCVAVKLLHPRLPQNPADQRLFLLRFEREGRATARLQHPNIAAVHDAGKHGTTPYLVLEYLRGRDLRAVLARDYPGGMPPAQALACAGQIASALAAAHAAGIVHRDIKPANVMMLDDGTCKVCDFGIARLLDSADPQLTQTGSVIGTPAYMPPEQFDGVPVSAAADVYALGVTLFHLLTGRPPFLESQFAALRALHASDQMPQVSSLRAEAAPLLDALVDWMLARQASDRPTAADVAARLGDPALAVPRAQSAPLTDMTAAAHVARRIEFGGTRGRVLATIAAEMVKSAPEEARKLRVEAAVAVRSERYVSHLDLIAIAQAIRPHDPPHAAELLTEAERHIRDKAASDDTPALHRSARALSQWDLRRLSRVWALADLGKAERLAGEIADMEARDDALCGIAQEAARTRPGAAVRIASDLRGVGRDRLLERIAGTLAEVDTEACLRVIRMLHPASHTQVKSVFRALAARDRSEAERVAAALPDPDLRAHALTAVACHVAGDDAARTQRILATIDANNRRRARQDVALAILDADPHAAAALLASADFDRYEEAVLVRICRQLAPVVPDLAERLARRMSGSFDCATALRCVAAAVAGSNPARAAALLDDAVRQAEECAHRSAMPKPLAEFAAEVMPLDPVRATALFKEAARMATARRIDVWRGKGTQFEGAGSRARRLLQVAEALAPFDVATAERLVFKARIEAGDCWMLNRVAAAFAAVDPAAAARVAGRAPTPPQRAEALTAAIPVAAAINPPAAMRMAEQITSQFDQDRAWAAITTVLVSGSADAAVRFARTLAESLEAADPRGWRRRTLPVVVVEEIAAVDPAAAQCLVTALAIEDQDRAWAAIAGGWAGVCHHCEGIPEYDCLPGVCPKDRSGRGSAEARADQGSAAPRTLLSPAPPSEPAVTVRVDPAVDKRSTESAE
ncbi:protein kinase [Streptomyces sp. NPDC004579]|uniref:serine/threonine-protein kinase n=1 Tax=Streptomyces sp. NPDC004579 TaxID=3154667 RepID=UPI0033ACFA5D